MQEKNKSQTISHLNLPQAVRNKIWYVVSNIWGIIYWIRWRLTKPPNVTYSKWYKMGKMVLFNGSIATFPYSSWSIFSYNRSVFRPLPNFYDEAFLRKKLQFLEKLYSIDAGWVSNTPLCKAKSLWLWWQGFWFHMCHLSIREQWCRIGNDFG